MVSTKRNGVAVANGKKTPPEAHGSSEPVELCMFWPKFVSSASATIDRTARYVEDPTKYLKESLGADVFEERKSRFCIPDVIDKDQYGTGKHKQHFEQFIANLLGKNEGLFFITGVQAQLAGLKSYCEQASNNRVAWHITSHLESAEEQAYKHLYGLERTLIGADPEENPTVDEIKKVLVLPEHERPAVIVLEIPNRNFGCKTYTYEELETISSECRKANVKIHCDGARMWDIEPYYVATAGKSFAELGGLFDSVYVSFYKGLGGTAGAVLASNSAELISAARVWQRRAGGNVFSLFYQVIDCERGYNENIGAFAEYRTKMIDVVDSITAATAKFTTPSGQKIVNFIPTRATCDQIHTVVEGFTEEELYSARDRVQGKTNVRVFGRLRRKQTVDEMMKEERALKAGAEIAALQLEDETKDQKHFTEWVIMSVNSQLATQTFVDAYVNLCQELTAAKKLSSHS